MADEITESGPIFHSNEAVSVMMENIGRGVADELLTRWLVNLDTSIRVNQHRYTSNLVYQREAAGTWKVTDGGVIYGPWLEGTGSRNSPKTRFPGYFSLRRAVDEMDVETSVIAEENVAKFCAEMNA